MKKILSKSHRHNIGEGVRKALKKGGGKNNHPCYLPKDDPKYQNWIKRVSKGHKGRKQSPEEIETRRRALLGRKVSQKTRDLIGKANRGHKTSRETREKLRVANTGRKHTNSEKNKIGAGVRKTFEKMGGHPLYQNKNSKRYKGWQKKNSEAHKGHKHTLKTRNKMSKAHSGKNHPNWQGGISYEPYSVDWTRTLKRSIRERAHYVCQICHTPQEDRAFDIHHIDYNKKNCDPDNLIALCISCHRKTNFGREYWQKRLSKKLNKK